MKSPSDKAKKSPVKIRFKELADGCKSIYLDIYFKGKRKYEFLKLYIHPGNDEETTLANAEAMRMAEEVRAQRLAQLGEPDVPEAAPTIEKASATTDEKTVKARARAKRTSREPVTLRAKDLKDGRQSLYLDIYFRGERSYEFLKLYTTPGEDEANEIIMQRANAIRQERMAEIAKPADTKAESVEATEPEKKSSINSKSFSRGAYSATATSRIISISIMERTESNDAVSRYAYISLPMPPKPRSSASRQRQKP